VSIEMSRDYLTAPVFVRPLGHAHPRAIFMDNDATVNKLLATWAAK
jgi:ribosome-binding factor A